MAKEQATYQAIFDTEIFEGELNLHKYPWHFHEAYTVVIVNEGAMRYVFRNGTVDVNSRHVFVINPFVAHYNSAVNSQTCRYSVIFLPVWLFNQQIDQSYLTCFERYANTSMYTQLSYLYGRLKQVRTEDAYLTIIHNISQLLLSGFNVKTENLASAEKIEPALQYIRQHLDEKLTITQLAAQCNLSHFHFQRLLKRGIGLTVTAYIQQCRMERGRELLRRGLKPVFTSLESGFFDQSHFYKQFKRMYALTPTHLTK